MTNKDIMSHIKNFPDTKLCKQLSDPRANEYHYSPKEVHEWLRQLKIIATNKKYKCDKCHKDFYIFQLLSTLYYCNAEDDKDAINRIKCTPQGYEKYIVCFNCADPYYQKYNKEKKQ